ncbi:MAG: hydantoinase/oxoprolinase family protein [Syntrophomonadaceae bacterium]|nr:hydantoinase/oxoprolinase family protein [Syntrophomonadaceae bacterium]
MLIGIDVGGTYTDGVVFNQSKVIATTKVPTDDNDIKSTVLQVLDNLLLQQDKSDISRIVLSTTVVTNLLATGKGERTALLLIPGYGLPADAYDISDDTFFLKGGIDFRGREIDQLKENELAGVCDNIVAAGIKRVAIVSKFGNRNDNLEKQVRDYIIKNYPQLSVITGSQISGKLNFPRRATTAYYTAMTSKEWNHFVDEIDKALAERGLDCEVHILKADGGTLALDISRDMPCETVFSGPAASTMGALALAQEGMNAVVLDIGGTTTDIALLIDGVPLYASKGASINQRYTHVNAFAVRSIALGGDSSITVNAGQVEVEAYRRDVAACFGGRSATVTDAFNCKFNLNIGNPELSATALEQLAGRAMSKEELGAAVVAIVVNRLGDAITSMFKEWENEPAYKVWEVINKRKFTLEQIIGIGAASRTIIPELADTMQVNYFIHQYADVANALGAAVARPTLVVNLHVDTQTKIYTLDPGGVRGSLENPRNFQLEDARQMARNHLQEVGKERGMASYTNESSFFMEEQFNMIGGWDRTGKLFDVGIQVTPGFIEEFKGVKA